MKKTFVRIIDDEEINIDAQQDFIDDNGNRHPRNVLWLWNDEDLWDVLHIRVDWEIEQPDPIFGLDPVQIPKEPDPPAPVLPPEEALPPAPPAADAPEPAPQPDSIHQNMMVARLGEAIPIIKDVGIEVDDVILDQLKEIAHTDAVFSPLVAYGGIAFRTLRLEAKGNYHQGHRHNYDHITNLIKGSVLCEVDGAKPKAYYAPCQITIAADHWHKFTALEDDVVYQCVYRQPSREDLYTMENSPYNLAPFTADELIERLKFVDNPCSHCSCDEVGEETPLEDGLAAEIYPDAMVPAKGKILKD